MTEEVKLTSLMPRLDAHTELDMKELRDLAARSDAAQQVSDYRAAIEAAQALLVGLVQSIAQELRRPHGEAVAVFRARKLALRGFQKSCRFLEQKRFFNEREKANVEQACVAAVVPDTDNGVDLETWSRIARQMVYMTVGQVAARYDNWRSGCSCPADYPAEAILFEPAGGGPPHERVICQRCRCPRKRISELRGFELPEAVGEALRESLLACARSMGRSRRA